MKRFTNDTPSNKHLPILLELDDSPVYFIGPATRENPMFQLRTKLHGKVVFQDRKIKWNRVTLQFTGKAGIDMEAPRSIFPKESSFGELDDSNSTTTRIQTTISICEVEKELIFSGEESIDFGLHLPPHLPASTKTNHAFVEYTLIANFSAGPFFKKYKTHKVVTINRHYLPNPSALIPTIEHTGVKEWFEWSAEVPKSVAIESGEVVLAFRCNVEKERVEVDRIELRIEEIETYRVCTKQGVHNLPPIVTRFPSATYHLPSFSSNSETHFIRSPIPYNKHSNEGSVHTHQFNPFLEVTHRCVLTVHFNKASSVNTDPIQLEFPLIITNYPRVVKDNNSTATEQNFTISAGGGGDDAVNVDLDLPEYTPRYEENLSY